MNNYTSLNNFEMNNYWGDIDSTIDWCEPNYKVTKYIAEFYNTISSIPIIIWSLMGLFLTQKYATKEMRFIFAFLMLSLVGLGSVLFHASLRYYFQLFD